MNIIYQKKLEANPVKYGPDGTIWSKNEPMTEEEVNSFQSYCIDKFELTDPNYKFPLAYREFLLLSGKKCYVYDMGANTQIELQEYVHSILEMDETEVSEPFCVIDVSGDYFPMIKLLDTNEDPQLYLCMVSGVLGQPIEILDMGYTITEFTDKRIQMVLEGKSIF